jgi:hypothetical protein
VRDFSLSKEGLSVAQQVRTLGARQRFDLDSLIFDEYSAHWREVVATIHRHLGYGTEERIGIVDSGFTEGFFGSGEVDRGASLDLTGEGIADQVGHGSAVGALVSLIAPNASLIHVKLFDRSGRIPGDSYHARVALIANAFEHLERVGATIVNVSWNYLTLIDEHPTDVRPGHFCRCPICAVFKRFVEATNADVFVSEGNFTYADGEGRPTGSWSCPAAAELVIPVLGYMDGKQRYNANLDTSAAIPAACQIRVPAAGTAQPVSLTGSSFATPLVAATYAALRSALRDNGFTALDLPRSHEHGDSATSSFTFPFAVFFASPLDDAEEMREWHRYWYVAQQNCLRAAEHEAKAGHFDNAGQLCRLMGDIMAVSYRRMAAWQSESWLNIAWLILELYVHGVSWLQQSNLAATGYDVLRSAAVVVEEAESRGIDLSVFKPHLARLAKVQRDKTLEFLSRLG